MQIVINHLTRMQAGFVCVAGLDLATGRHVRPVLRKQLRTSWLSCRGGPFEIAAVVDLGRTKRIGKPPELEDTLFRADEAEAIGALETDDFWALLDRSARCSLKELFGPDLQRLGSWSCVLPVHHGHASLGLYRPVEPRLFVEQHAGRARIRMRFRSGQCQFRAPVTDIRLYREDHLTPHVERVRQVNTLLAEGREVIFSVGLSRRFKKAAADPALHWLQINNLHFADRPVWTLSPQLPAASLVGGATGRPPGNGLLRRLPPPASDETKPRNRRGRASKTVRSQAEPSSYHTNAVVPLALDAGG